MATYKVLQDIEAEDTLIGPLTLRQCIYGAIAAICIYLSVVAFSKGAAWLILFFLPFIGFGIFFAFPWNKQQSTEVWALAKVRFALKPRKRIWDQSGVKNLVTVTVPKVLMDPRARHMTENEVRSRLKALADTIDSRGWAVKNAPLSMFLQPGMMSGDQMASDRLVEPTNLPREVPTIDATHAEDMFDLANNPLAQQFDAKMAASSSAHHQQLVNQMNNPSLTPVPTATVPSNWYAAAPAQAAPQAPAAIPISANPTPEEEAFLLKELKHKQELSHKPLDGLYSNLRTIQPLSAQPAPAAIPTPVPVATPIIPSAAAPAPMGTPVVTPVQPAIAPVAPTTPTPVTAKPNPAILELANNNDLSVATIAREARIRNADGTDEVIVSLH